MNNDYIKVKDHPALVRDRKSNAILNVDDNAYNKYRNEREKLFQEKKEQEQLKKDVADIKILLQKLLENK